MFAVPWDVGRVYVERSMYKDMRRLSMDGCIVRPRIPACAQLCMLALTSPGGSCFSFLPPKSVDELFRVYARTYAHTRTTRAQNPLKG